MKIRAYTVVERAVDEGLRLMAHRLFKHRDAPFTNPDELIEAFERQSDTIMTALTDVIDFDDEEVGLKE